MSGRAHVKHTEGGDFRQSVYRAVRQGLMQAKSVLLEPWYAFVLTVPTEQIGRGITDIRAMGGEFEAPEAAGSLSTLRGLYAFAAENEKDAVETYLDFSKKCDRPEAAEAFLSIAREESLHLAELKRHLEDTAE